MICMNTKYIVIGFLILIFLGLVSLTVTRKGISSGAVYTYEPAGVTLSYMGVYTYEETREGDIVRVVLKNKDQKENQKIGDILTEGLPQISCIIVPNKSDMTIPLWVESEAYQQTEGRLIEGSMYPSVDITGVDAIGFKTDGLYATDHVAFIANKHIVDCSVSYITPDDTLRMDFVSVLSGITIK